MVDGISAGPGGARERRRLLLLLASVIGCAAGSLTLPVQAQEDGLRRIEAKRYGVTVSHPQAWQLSTLQRGAHAFVLSLPKDHPGEPAGTVACEIAPAPASLHEFQKSVGAPREGAAPEIRKLELNALLPALAAGPPAKSAPDQLATESIQAGAPLQSESLEVVWTYVRPRFGLWYELRRHVIQNGQLYTFIMNVDEGHFDAYRMSFDQMLQTAHFQPVETGLVQIADGSWMQRDFAFGLKLPDNWQPGLGTSDRILFFATGARTVHFAENLAVLASPRQPLDLDKLRADLPAELQKADPHAKVVRCELVNVGRSRALETVLQTRRGGLDVTILERRFQGTRSNYEIRFTVLSEHFEKSAGDLKSSADSFREFPLPGQRDVI